jgi:ABC-type branched-subunit amino acid transport system substrate-binding protein
MKSRKTRTLLSFVIGIVTVLAFIDGRASAHCDGMDGPVVKTAQKALAAGNVNLALIWVQQKDEGEVRKAFQKALAVRRLNPEAREMADIYFFETLVRLHRAGEGEPYTGIKPAGRDLGPAIPAADKAIEQKSAQQLRTLLTGTIQDGLQERFKNVLAKSSYSKDDVAAGREFVKAYVEFIHYAEQVYQVGKGNPSDAHPGEGHAVAK